MPVLALDQGTTGSTALVIGDDGRVLGRGYREITQYYPRPGWVEHDAEEIVERTCAAARDAITASGVQPTAIGITNQRETVVVWDRSTRRPVSKAIVWQDRRTSERCAEIAAHDATRRMIEERTGLVVDAYFSASKLEWMLRDEALRARAHRGDLLCGTIDSWLVWCLTNGHTHATEPTNASRTMLYDIERRSWSDELCELFGVPRSLLPEVRPSAGDFGVANGSQLGLQGDVPITGIAGDQQAALYGQGCWTAGSTKSTYGTGAFLLMNAGERRPESGGGVLTTLACDERGNESYALESSIFIAGAAVQWLRDGLGIIGKASETEALARSVDSNDGVYFVPALVGLGAPYWESNARGTIVGLTRGSTRAHLVRAALESMAYGTADVLHEMESLARDAFRSSEGARLPLRVDGGATSNDWLMQFQADVLDRVVQRPDMIETTALGAAGLAGIASGVWSSGAEFLGTRQFTSFNPGDGREVARGGQHGWQRAVRAALSWARDGN